jgi:hypothetical protein
VKKLSAWCAKFSKMPTEKPVALLMKVYAVVILMYILLLTIISGRILWYMGVPLRDWPKLILMFMEHIQWGGLGFLLIFATFLYAAMYVLSKVMTKFQR